MSNLNGCTKVKDLAILENLRELAHGQGVAPVRVKNVQIACDKCSQGIMDYDNPHLWGKCQCDCHQPAGRRVVHVQHSDGTTETELEWLERQMELDDYLQTVHDASYRGQ